MPVIRVVGGQKMRVDHLAIGHPPEQPSFEENFGTVQDCLSDARVTRSLGIQVQRPQWDQGFMEG